MGRYYTGDIEGKFWFGVQSSDDGEFFGAKEIERNCIDYEVDDITEVAEGVEHCKKVLGEDKERLDKFFDGLKFGYNDEMIKKHWADEFGVEMSDMNINVMLQWYARLELGEKILACMEKNGVCNFSAEV